MKRTTPPVDPVKASATIRAHWSSIVLATCMRHAALLNLVPYGESELSKLPPNVYEVAFRLCTDIRDRAAAAETKLGCRPSRLEQQVNQEIWNGLRPFAKPGEFYVEHIVPRGTRSDTTQQLSLEEPS